MSMDPIGVKNNLDLKMYNNVQSSILFTSVPLSNY